LFLCINICYLPSWHILSHLCCPHSNDLEHSFSHMIGLCKPQRTFVLESVNRCDRDNKNDFLKQNILNILKFKSPVL